MEKKLWIKEVNGYVVDVLYNYSPGIEKAGYKAVEVDQATIPSNVSTGYYMYDAETATFLLDEEKLFADFDALKAKTVDSPVNYMDIMDSQLAIFEAIESLKQK